MAGFVKYLIYLGVFFSILSSGAQNNSDQKSILFSSFFAEKNLSSLSITCFFQDSRHNMWIGTHDGLNFFNGKTIKVFKHDYQDKNSLPDNLIMNICEDKRGNVWVATSWGISRLNPELFRFENYTVDAKNEGLGFKVQVYVDKEDRVWAFSTNLYLLNKSTNKFEKKIIRIENKTENTLTPKLYTGIFEDSRKRFWVSCDNNLYRYFPAEEKFVTFGKRQKNTFFFPVAEDPSGNLFCGTWGDGFLKLDTVAGATALIENEGIRSAFAFQQFNGHTIVWYGNALSAYDITSGSVTHFTPDNNNPYARKDNAVSALFVDRQNQLWIGYGSKGVQIMSPSNQVFKTYTLSEKPDMFPIVASFIRTKKYCYAGAWYKYSLIRMDSNYKPVKIWKSLIPAITMDENNISDAWLDPHDNIWFTSCFGLIKLNEKTDKTELFKPDTSMLKRSHFLQMLPEGDSVLWLAGYFCGLTRFSIKTKAFQNYGGKERALYWSIAKDNKGMIWLANNSSALTGFDPVKKVFIEKRYTDLTENACYNHVVFDSIGNALWIATNNGLLRVNRETFAARLFTEKDNLPTSQVNSLQFDSHHRLWIATNKGLCFYDTDKNIIKTFFSNNGLPANTLNQLFKLERNGELFIGSPDGFSILQTNAVPNESPSQSVIIDKIYESGNIIPIDTSQNKKSIVLNYDKNNIQIEFYSTDLINSDDNQLLFRLEGFDNQWRTAQNGVVNYSKLSPGKYLFHVSGINHAGVKLKSDDYLSITINPPVWKTTWFIVLISAGMFCLTLLAARYVFTRNLREKILILENEQAIEKERSRISQDMHDELGSGLTKISIMSEVAMTQLTDSEKAKKQLEGISDSSRELVDNLQDIIWILNSKNDSLENLCAYLQEYALKYFEAFDISVQVNYPENISNVKLSEDQRRNILLVFKESFNNISKHSGCTTVILNMKNDKETVSFSLSDNGKGFDKKAIRNFANGLQNMRKRMISINGTFKIDSVIQQGTSLEFTFGV